MSYQAIKEYLVVLLSRYQNAGKKKKSALLDEAVAQTGLSRKHLIRVLALPPEVVARKKPSGRHAKYPKELLLEHVKQLWIGMERISARRMKAGFADWLGFYEHPEFTTQVRLMLERMSASTLDRFLCILRKDARASRGLSTTCPARFMKNRVPINTLDHKIDKPGFTQADTVAHCGTSAAGPFANTLTLTDIDSTWTENRALFTKKGYEVRKCFVDIKKALPFDLLAINVDSGSEFLNSPMLGFVKMPGEKEIAFTRSRAYKKNDNCYVEQKNFTHVRELFGYERIEDPRLIDLMNDIYTTCWNPLQNYFLPTFKLKEKIRVGAKIVKKFDAPQTPYHRLMKSAHVSEVNKVRIKMIQASLNPFKLKADLEARLSIFFEKLRKSKTREAA